MVTQCACALDWSMDIDHKSAYVYGSGQEILVRSAQETNLYVEGESGIYANAWILTTDTFGYTTEVDYTVGYFRQLNKTVSIDAWVSYWDTREDGTEYDALSPGVTLSYAPREDLSLSVTYEKVNAKNSLYSGELCYATLAKDFSVSDSMWIRAEVEYGSDSTFELDQKYWRLKVQPTVLLFGNLEVRFLGYEKWYPTDTEEVSATTIIGFSYSF